MKVQIVVVSLFLLAFTPLVCRTQTEKNQLTTFTSADFTHSSPGQFVAGWNAGTKIVQTSRASVGASIEYRRLLWGNNSAGLLYTRTPTNSKLSLPQNQLVIWPITRDEFDVLFTRRLQHLNVGKFSPYATGGAGAIMLNGNVASGLDGQFAYVAGGGADVKIAHRLTMRLGFTADILKASTYSDKTYRSSWTVMAEPRFGFVVPLGFPPAN